MFIQDFSKIAVRVTHLTKKNVTFRWGPDQQLAINSMRLRLCEASILKLINDMDYFVAYHDASITGLGVVLMHRGHVKS